LFRKELSVQLAELPPPMPITNQNQMDSSCKDLTKAIQHTIKSKIPVLSITPKSKCWWTKELMQLWQLANKLGRQLYQRWYNTMHTIHGQHSAAVKNYRRILEQTKCQHWWDWLEKGDDPDLWTAHRLVSSSGSDGGKTGIPVLAYKDGDKACTASTNHEKGRVLARSFFPAKPCSDSSLSGYKYPKACLHAGKVMQEQIRAQLKKLKPYKAPGPDSIPNIVLTRCADELVERLFYIYQAMLEKSLMYKPWKEFNTVVLCKPGKPSYNIPKAYRPIALLNTMWKVIMAIVASHITFYTEKYQLLPANHFGGCPGRTTADVIHLLTNKVKVAWRKQEVVSVLFLDIEGAFPNVNPMRLVHNIRNRHLPSKYTNFVQNMLTGRATVLKFNGYASEQMIIDNRIGQGDPLSMVLYQYYNADLLDIPEHKGEEAVAYVDNTFMLALGKDFQVTHRKLHNMMSKQRGVVNWSKMHSSPLEYSKLVLINFASRHKKADNLPLLLPHVTFLDLYDYLFSCYLTISHNHLTPILGTNVLVPIVSLS